MKALKKILLGIVALIALVLIIALFVKRDFAVERSITINKPNQEVFDYVKILKNQKNWSTYSQADPEMKEFYKGTDGTVGAVYGWESKMMGNGEQVITKVVEGERVDIDLIFKGMMGGTSPAYLATKVLSDSTTQVTWAMSGKMNYPMNFMGLFMSMDDMIGSEYQKSLEQLKGVLEK
ncbi:MAG: SRPBCC family protein [Haliscomenobacter sp.]|uniref:SRPBCC family protein n=1 Tax=Haliscomenobacter sp. TaxID=2717303 RepID=UPI0029A9FC64|nr:SRPBCC family protein [Haliscomenobacter sp.]MDX2069811.1 SRPBCC family protein [Haliscomenobacter sp.]